LGLFFFPFDFINLQVHKPASADLLTSQFTKDLREIHPDFSSRFFVTGARLFHPTGAHRARMHLCNQFISARMRFTSQFCQRAGAICASVHTGGRASALKFAL
jgi:hypothetical protein